MSARVPGHGCLCLTACGWHDVVGVVPTGTRLLLFAGATTSDAIGWVGVGAKQR